MSIKLSTEKRRVYTNSGCAPALRSPGCTLVATGTLRYDRFPASILRVQAASTCTSSTEFIKNFRTSDRIDHHYSANGPIFNPRRVFAGIAPRYGQVEK